MRFSVPTSLCFAALGLAQSPPQGYGGGNEPVAPGLTFLYRSYAVCGNGLYNTEGPRGIRTAIPILGGNVTGPRIKGQFRDLGADWGVTDVQTGIFSADTRYNLLTDDGANIFLQTSGPAQPSGDLHLRIVFETGDKKYYWLNNVIAVGVLHEVASNATTFTLRIDAWHVSRHEQADLPDGALLTRCLFAKMTSEWNSTTFINGTTYA
ncbi:hypothetical protein LTR86_008509 [Recurvomyces mirabilis]|nr:hypothetical protein LTR86_008509 [Recurvomyces mirabilis]